MLPTIEMDIVKERVEEYHRQASRARAAALAATGRRRHRRRAVGELLQAWGERLVESTLPPGDRGALAGDCDC